MGGRGGGGVVGMEGWGGAEMWDPEGGGSRLAGQLRWSFLTVRVVIFASFHHPGGALLVYPPRAFGCTAKWVRIWCLFYFF